MYKSNTLIDNEKNVWWNYSKVKGFDTLVFMILHFI